MKNHFTYFLLAALVCAMGIVSCQRGGLTPEEQKAQQEQEQAEKTSRFWSVVGQLVAASVITDDYKGKTFEPVIGVPDASDAQTRIVATNSAAAAAKSFANLVNEESITEQTTSYTWRDDEVGTLTYSKGTSGAWAEVKVDIPAVPHLSKLIYRSPEQGDDNASFEGSAYYRFGDVISLTKNGKTEYWVCVRPAFNPEGKGDSHWMSIGDLPEENIWHYTGSNGMDYYFPTKLKYNKEHMQNLAELLYALCYPDTWSQNITNYSTVGTFGSPGGLPMFHDFRMTNLKYHNANFWNNVASAWKTKGVDVQLFGKTLDGIAQEIESTGLHFLYNGYSWWTATSNYATVYQAKFVNVPGSVHANMQTEKPYTEQKVQMIYKNQPSKDVPFDVRGKKGVINASFFGDNAPRYIVRYAKGSELSSTGKYSDVHEAIPGATSVYRYYADVIPVTDVESHEPEITDVRIVNSPNAQNMNDFTGIAHYKTGTVLQDADGAYWMVVNLSGTGGAAANDCDASPYAELISFEGLSNTGNLTSVPELPTYDEAVRAMFFLHNLFQNSFPDAETSEGSLTNLKPSGQIVKILLEQVRMNILRTHQVVAPVSGNPRNHTHMTSFAYNDPMYNGNGQPVCRFLYPIDLNNARPPFYFWKHYPSKPDAVSQTYDSYSDELIYLQDVADPAKVAKYGPDLYATKGFHPDQATNGQTEAPRQYRTTADQTARQLNAYYYDFDRWNRYQYPTDMWNEPVLFFRVDAIYDRGNEYATITKKGRKIQGVVLEFPAAAVSTYSDNENEYKDFEDSFINALYNYKTATWKDRDGGTVYQDGKNYLIPDWKAVWDRH